MSIGYIQIILVKQNINTKIATEAELAAANYVLSHLLWAKNVLKQQGYIVAIQHCINIIQVQYYWKNGM